MFEKGHISFFTVYALRQNEYSPRLDSIARSMEELDRLRRLLITKRERFKAKLGNVSEPQVGHSSNVTHSILLVPYGFKPQSD